jgi:transcriptional regulator
MINESDIDDIDRKIMQMRALGYNQMKIAETLNMSQSAISQRLERLKSLTEGKNPEEIEKLFWTIILGAGAIYILSKILEKK